MNLGTKWTDCGFHRTGVVYQPATESSFLKKRKMPTLEDKAIWEDEEVYAVSLSSFRVLKPCSGMKWTCKLTIDAQLVSADSLQ